jgi:hypothetical protein
MNMRCATPTHFIQVAGPLRSLTYGTTSRPMVSDPRSLSVSTYSFLHFIPILVCESMVDFEQVTSHVVADANTQRVTRSCVIEGVSVGSYTIAIDSGARATNGLIPAKSDEMCPVANDSLKSQHSQVPRARLLNPLARVVY